MDVEPTAKIIDNMAKIFQGYSDNLSDYAKQLRISKDFDYASEAMQAVVNCISSLRLDLLVTRPMRELIKYKESKEIITPKRPTVANREPAR